MPEAAITLPLDVVRRLTEMAGAYLGPSTAFYSPEDKEALAIADREITQVEQLIEEMRQQDA